MQLGIGGSIHHNIDHQLPMSGGAGHCLQSDGETVNAQHTCDFLGPKSKGLYMRSGLWNGWIGLKYASPFTNHIYHLSSHISSYRMANTLLK